MKRPPNTDLWKFVIAAGRDIYKKRHPHRDLERLFGIERGRLRQVIDRELPEHIIAAIEERISLAAGEKYGLAHEAAIATEDVMTGVRARIAERKHERARERLRNDPTEKALWREFVMNNTFFYDEAERAEYEAEFA
jgi:hypothetical protein